MKISGEFELQENSERDTSKLPDVPISETVFRLPLTKYSALKISGAILRQLRAATPDTERYSDN